MRVCPEGWLASHPYLRQVADLHSLVDTAVAESSSSTAMIPDWNTYVEDYKAGVPLLRSSAAAIDLSGAFRQVQRDAGVFEESLRNEAQLLLAATAEIAAELHAVIGDARLFRQHRRHGTMARLLQAFEQALPHHAVTNHQ